MELHPRTTPSAEVRRSGPSDWDLALPPGPEGEYRWAQLDDYLHRRRKDFLWQPPFRLKLRAKVSHADIPGTWGFGLWNDPFNFSFGIGGTSRRLPALPNAAWFFFAGAENYLSFRDDLPANGFLAAVFSSPLIPPPFLGLGLPLLPLLTVPRTSRLLRSTARRLIREDSCALEVATTDWHEYCLEWEPDAVHFSVDGGPAFSTNIVPRGKMGLVLWVDNQFAAYPPDGRVRMGTLKTEHQINLEIMGVEIAGKENFRKETLQRQGFPG